MIGIRIDSYWLVLIGIDWYWFVLIGIDWYWLVFVLIGIDWYWFVLIRIDSYWFVLIRIDWYWLVLIGIDWFSVVSSLFYRCSVVVSSLFHRCFSVGLSLSFSVLSLSLSLLSLCDWIDFTRCVTSRTDHHMKRRARITLNVEVIRCCIFIFLLYVSIQGRVRSIPTLFSMWLMFRYGHTWKAGGGRWRFKTRRCIWVNWWPRFTFTRSNRGSCIAWRNWRNTHR